jgi:hypothetical protein
MKERREGKGAVGRGVRGERRLVRPLGVTATDRSTQRVSTRVD